MMTDKKTTVEELKTFIKEFKAARDWDQFNTPKNLSMAIAIEAAELMEHFMWTENAQASEAQLEKKEKKLSVNLLIFSSICFPYVLATTLI